MAAQLTATKGWLCLGLALCMLWARSSLPVPLFPLIRIPALVEAYSTALSIRLFIRALSATMSSKVYFAIKPLLRSSERTLCSWY